MPAVAPTAPPPAPASPAVATPPAPSKTPPARQPLDQYKVLLHNDDTNDMLFVVQSIVQIAHLPTPRALKVMLEAHNTGLGLVTITHQELAELYREQFTSKGLSATIEKA
ncbi:MAG: ATP-dependent Clp protease adaptor ClpS [bacterium]